MAIFRITTKICKQVLPVSLDLDHPVFGPTLDWLRRITEGQRAAHAQGGVISRVCGFGLTSPAPVRLAPV